MERIVLGYDGGVAASAALEWTIDRCRARPAHVTIVEVDSAWEVAGGVGPSDLDAAADAVRQRAPGTELATVRVRGGVVSALADFGAGSDLLVIGVHRGSHVRAMLTGMRPTRLAARATRPVVLVPAGWTFSSGPVTVGVDDDDSSVEALVFAAREAARDHRALRLVHAWLMSSPDLRSPGAPPRSPYDMERAHRGILAEAERVAEESAGPGVEIDSILVRDNPTSALSRSVPGSALVVIGAHGRGPAAGMLLGSVAWDLIGELDRPLCVVPTAA